MTSSVAISIQPRASWLFRCNLIPRLPRFSKISPGYPFAIFFIDDVPTAFRPGLSTMQNYLFDKRRSDEESKRLQNLRKAGSILEDVQHRVRLYNETSGGHPANERISSLDAIYIIAYFNRYTFSLCERQVARTNKGWNRGGIGVANGLRSGVGWRICLEQRLAGTVGISR